MRISASRTIRPRALWGTALLGAVLTFVAPTLADDAAEAPAAKGAAKGEKPAGLKKAKEAKEGNNAKKPAGAGAKASGKEKGPGAKQAKKPDGKGETKGKDKGKAKGKKRKHPPVSRRVAVSEYKRAVVAMKSAEKALSADDPAAALKAQAEHKRAMKALQKAKRRLARANRSDARKLKTMSTAERQKIETKLQARAKKLAADRKERAEKSEETIKKELGDKVKLAPVKAELERHAWRVARLERLIAIAEASGRTQTAVRAKQLLDKENAAHPERLKRASGEKVANSPTKGAAAAAPAPKVAAPVAKTAPQPPTTPAPAKEGAQ